jgi:hypothetical protein
MATTSNIRICLVSTTPSSKIIDNLMANGWQLNDQGKISYLPLGDKDNYDWQIQQDIDYLDLLKIVKNKELNNEPVGIIMSWKNTAIGISIIIRKEGTLSIDLNINRQDFALNDHYKITDFQWYLKRLLPCLDDAFGVESFSCEQHR